MAIEFVCPSCNGTLQVGDDAAGRVIRCGGCLTMLRVPGGPAASPGGSAPPSPFETSPPLPPPPSRRSSGSPAEVEPLPDERRRRRRRDRDRDRDRDDDSEDYDRPRRSRGDGGEGPPPGRGVLIWLVVIGAVVFLAIIGCCGALFMRLPKEEWQTHESKAGGFKVELPAKPKANVQKDAGIPLDKDTKAEGAILFPQQVFVVIYRDIPSTKDRLALPKPKTDEDEIEEALNKLLAVTEAPLQPIGQQIKVNGFPGTEVSYQNRGGRRYTARIIVADTRRYIVLTGGPQQDGSPAVRRFIESFEITDPDLVRIGQERAKKDKDAP